MQWRRRQQPIASGASFAVFRESIRARRRAGLEAADARLSLATIRFGGLPSGGLLGEMTEPIPGDPVQAFAVEGVDTLASTALHANQSGHFKLSQVAARGRPGAVETRGDLAGCHFTAVKMQYQEDMPPGCMRERGKDGVEVLELASGVPATQARRADARAETPCWTARSASRSACPSVPRWPSPRGAREQCARPPR